VIIMIGLTLALAAITVKQMTEPAKAEIPSSKPKWGGSPDPRRAPSPGMSRVSTRF
jgi:hypothetical protein